jgi:hypothetical protein
VRLQARARQYQGASTSGAHPAQLDDVGRGSQHVGCRGAGAGCKEAAGGSGGVVFPPHSAGMYTLFGFFLFGILFALMFASSIGDCRDVCCAPRSPMPCACDVLCACWWGWA